MRPPPPGPGPLPLLPLKARGAQGWGGQWAVGTTFPGTQIAGAGPWQGPRTAAAVISLLSLHKGFLYILNSSPKELSLEKD